MGTNITDSGFFSSFSSKKIPIEILSNPAFARHVGHFSSRIGKHLAAPLSRTRAAIMQARHASTINEAWATSPPHQRTARIDAQQLRRRANELDEEGERLFSEAVGELIGELPPVPPLSGWAGASASHGWSGIRHIADRAAELTNVMFEDELDGLAARCGVPGQTPEARRARLKDALWLRKKIRSEIRKYRECGWYRLAPLHINRSSVDSQFDDRSQNKASENFIRKFGRLKNKQSNEIINLPNRSTQLKRRNAELMARKKGLSNKAKRLGLAGFIVTFTCPSAFHPTTSSGGKRRENPRYDRSLNAMDAHIFLRTQFAALGRWAAKNEIPILGMRAVHPHTDGCPHWHLVLCLHPSDAARVEKYIVDRFTSRQVGQIDFQPLKPLRGGQDSVDAAMSYAAAYLSAAHVESDESQLIFGESGLEIEGQTTPDLYRAWRRAYSFREFSFFEFGLGARQRGLVTAWRLMRKRRPPQAIAEALQGGDWLRFEDLCRENEAKLVYSPGVNSFGESVSKLAGVALKGGIFVEAASCWKPLWKRHTEGGRDLVSKNQVKAQDEKPDDEPAFFSPNRIPNRPPPPHFSPHELPF